MTFQKTMLSIAMESGEIETQEEIMGYEPDASEDADEYLELINSHAGEISRTVAVTQSLEALAARYEGQDVTNESMESYHFAVAQVLHASGASIPASVVAPSFEDAAADKKTIGQKAKGVIDALIKWIRERIASLKAMFKRFIAKLGFGEKKLKERNNAAIEAVAEMKKEGVVEIVSSGSAEDEPKAGEKPEAKSSEDAKERVAAKMDEKFKNTSILPEKDNDEHVASKNKERTKKRKVRVPATWVKGGKLDIDGIEAHLKAVHTGKMANLLDFQNESGAEIKDNEIEAWLKSDPYTKAFKEWKETVGVKMEARYMVDLDDLKNLILFAESTTNAMSAKCRTAAASNKMADKALSAATKETDPSKAASLRALAQAELNITTDVASFCNNVRSACDAYHKILCSLAR